MVSDSSITAAVLLYQAQSQNLALELGERNYKVYTDFLFSTFFTHFQLYKHVLAQPRRENIPQVGLFFSPSPFLLKVMCDSFPHDGP